ncbi:hypothetical protein TrLO_g9450 [Triparma laevis f. longispina]|uniref:Kinesin light chain n=1 Tax=Triparma laevis f. longispina TaxID=1714387 RepID=A0A9W7FSL2_9STRA|nr:hypothetical protein TrLO_g9450 [Triparma laevis f. longispina]
MQPVVEKKVRGKKNQKKKKNGPRNMEILDAGAVLGLACNNVGDFDDAIRYLKRAKEGYEEQLGRDNEKTLQATRCFIMSTAGDYSHEELIEKLRDLFKRCERALGEENVVTLHTLSSLGCELDDNEEYEEAREVHERCLAGRVKVLGEDHKDTLMVVHNLGLLNQMLGNTHPDTLMTVVNIAVIYKVTWDYEKAEELYERALEGYEAQHGKDHEDTKRCARNFMTCLARSGNIESRAQLICHHPWLNKKNG